MSTESRSIPRNSVNSCRWGPHHLPSLRGSVSPQAAGNSQRSTKRTTCTVFVLRAKLHFCITAPVSVGRAPEGRIPGSRPPLARSAVLVRSGRCSLSARCSDRFSGVASGTSSRAGFPNPQSLSGLSTVHLLPPLLRPRLDSGLRSRASYEPNDVKAKRLEEVARTQPREG